MKTTTGQTRNMIVSAVCAGAAIGLTAYVTTSNVKASIITAVVAILKDLQAFYSTSPKDAGAV